MREEEELLALEELIPISQTLISPHLRLAFNIPSPSPPARAPEDFDSSGDDPARTLKRPRLVWTPQLHKRFVDAVAHLGIKNAVPKTIMQLMSVDGLTRENVASHLQKYRLYLKRMQGLSPGAASNDSASDQLFATSPVPPHFLPFLHHQMVPPHQQFHHHLHHNQYQRRQVGHFGHTFMMRPSVNGPLPHCYVEDIESGTTGRKALTLFPAGGD